MNYIDDIRAKVGHEPIILVFGGGILANEDNEILLQKHSDFNEWGLPGGAIEFGETAEEACVREFKEEIGIDVKVISLMGVSTDNIQHYPTGDVAQTVVIEFLVKKISSKNSNTDTETIKFDYFGKENIPKIFNKQHKFVIDKFFKNEIPFYN